MTEKQATKVQTITAYAGAKLVNAMLKEAGVEKGIPAQMLYNYTKARMAQGKAPLIGTDPATGYLYLEDLVAWAKKYVEKKAALSKLDA